MDTKRLDTIISDFSHIQVRIISFLDYLLDAVAQNKTASDFIWEMVRVWRYDVIECNTVDTECFNKIESRFLHIHVWIMKSLKEFLNFISQHEIDSNVVWKMLSMSRVCIS